MRPSLILLPLLWACSPAPVLHPAEAPSNSSPSDTADRAPAPVAKVGTFTSDAGGFHTHSHWVDTGREVVVFDAQFTPDLAQRVITEIAANTNSPIRYVVITHPNPDKFNGVEPFRRLGAKVVASEATKRAIPAVHEYKKSYFVGAGTFTEETYPALATVDITFSGDFELPLDGDLRVQLHELDNPGVSSTQTVAYVPELSALYVGDLIHYHTHAWLEGGIVDGKPHPDLARWTRALDELKRYEGATVYAGRGPATPIDEALAAQREYLEQMKTIVESYVTNLEDAPAALSGESAGKHYEKLTEAAKTAFPDYEHPYLVRYGVYGLALSLAQR